MQYQHESQKSQSTDLQVFNSPQFGEIRTALSASNEPLFCLADVCKALSLSNPRKVKTQLNQRGVTISYVGVQTGIKADGSIAMQEVPMNFIDEPNLYKCIFKSRKKEAEQFQDWVCSEVLPAIRKQGGYITTNPNDDEQTILAKAIIIANSTIEKIKADNQRLSQKIEEDAPKVLFANTMATSNDTVLVAELAKIITQAGCNIGQNRMFQWLRDNHYLGSKGDYYNQPTQKAMDMGLFVIKKQSLVLPRGEVKITTTTKVTQKGVQYLVNKFMNQRN